MALERLRIQNALISAAMSGTFFSVKYDTQTREASYAEDPGSFDPEHTQVGPYGVPAAFIEPAPTNALKRIAPTSVRCNEVGSQFGPSNGTRTFGYDRISWSFEMILEFDGEVSIEQFEQDMTIKPMKLPRNVDLGLREVTLRLSSSTPTHPAMLQPNQGTRVTFRIEAELSPA